MMDTRIVSEIQQTTEELLKLMGLDVNVVVEVGAEKVVKISLYSDEESENEKNLGVLIGYHGATLYSLQRILSLMINKGREEWFRVEVDVDGYRKKREEALKSLTKRSVEKARFLGEEVSLPPMNASDRRIVHLTVSDLDDVSSESVGEDPRRRVVIRPHS